LSRGSGINQHEGAGIGISVIIPVFNAEKWVAEGVSSVANQKHVSEVVLVEDGSRDKSLMACEHLAESNPNVRLLRHLNGENRGAGASRNLGVYNAKSDLIAFLDADDVCLPDRFDLPAEMLAENRGIDGVYEAIGTMYEDEDAKRKWEALDWGDLTTVRKVLHPGELFYYLVMWKAGHFSLDGLVIRKELFYKVGGFNEALRLHQDSDFSIKAAAVGNLAPGRLDEPVALRRVHSDNRFVKKREDAMQSRLLAWRAFNDWVKDTNQKRARRLLVGYRLSRVLTKHYREQRNYGAALFHFVVSRLMGVAVSARVKMLGPSSF
jgi:glycosyltransferase involved in cell wall biosynthesis